MNVFVLPNTKEDILKNVGNRAVLGHHWLPLYFFSYYGSQWCPKTAWLQTFFKISSFVFSRTKKFIQVWNYLRVSKWLQDFHFWVNCPFKLTVILRNAAQFTQYIKNRHHLLCMTYFLLWNIIEDILRNVSMFLLLLYGGRESSTRCK